MRIKLALVLFSWYDCKLLSTAAVIKVQNMGIGLLRYDYNYVGVGTTNLPSTTTIDCTVCIYAHTYIQNLVHSTTFSIFADVREPKRGLRPGEL